MSGVTREQREREPFRWCVFCDTDCDVAEPEHAEDCPSLTGVYPVRERDLRCPGCGQTEAGMECVRCGAPFALGDSYMHAAVDPRDDEVGGSLAEQMAGAAVVEVVCMSCAWAESGAVDRG